MNRQQVNEIQDQFNSLEDNLRDYKINLSLIEEQERKIDDYLLEQQAIGSDRSSEIRQLRTKIAKNQTYGRELKRLVQIQLELVTELIK